MLKLLHLLFFILLSSVAHAQSGSFTDYCKSKMLEDSVKMNTIQSNISLGRNYKYHIISVRQPNSMYKTTYYYPLLEKGLNREVYRTNVIDVNYGRYNRYGIWRNY